MHYVASERQGYCFVSPKGRDFHDGSSRKLKSIPLICIWRCLHSAWKLNKPNIKRRWLYMWNLSLAKFNISDSYVHRFAECCMSSGESTFWRNDRSSKEAGVWIASHADVFTSSPQNVCVGGKRLEGREKFSRVRTQRASPTPLRSIAFSCLWFLRPVLYYDWHACYCIINWDKSKTTRSSSNYFMGTKLTQYSVKPPMATISGV